MWTPLLAVFLTVVAVGIGWEIREHHIRRQARTYLHDAITADRQTHIRVVEQPTVAYDHAKEREP